MKIGDIVNRINTIIGHGNSTYSELVPYMDECIDQINEDLGFNLPLISEVYANDFDINDSETADGLVFTENSTDNEYTRVPDPYLRNFLCYEVAFRRLRDEDEDQEVYGLKFNHAQNWYRKLIGAFSNYTLTDTETITVNGDVEDVGVDDTAVGFYNASSSLWPED